MWHCISHGSGEQRQRREREKEREKRCFKQNRKWKKYRCFWLIQVIFFFFFNLLIFFFRFDICRVPWGRQGKNKNLRRGIWLRCRLRTHGLHHLQKLQVFADMQSIQKEGEVDKTAVEMNEQFTKIKWNIS